MGTLEHSEPVKKEQPTISPNMHAATLQEANALNCGMADNLEKTEETNGSSLLDRMKIESRLSEYLKTGRLAINLNGHFKNGSRLQESPAKLLGHSVFSLRSLGESDFKELKTSLEALEEGGEPKALSRYLVLNGVSLPYECGCCGSRLPLETNGVEVRVKNPCQYPEGNIKFEVELNVPSGKIVFANDIRDWFPVMGEYDINNEPGMRKTSEKHAEFGMAHFFVGNTCPAIYQPEKGKLSISRAPQEDRWDKEQNEYVDLSPAETEATTPAGTKVGSITTDLWWWCGVDYDEFKRRVEKAGQVFEKVLNENACVVVEVDAGVYRITHSPEGYEDENQGAKPFHYSLLEKVREPEALKDFAVLFDRDFTAGEVLLSSIREYPTLYFWKDSTEPELTGDDLLDEINRTTGRIARYDEVSKLEGVSDEEFMAAWNALSDSERTRSLARAADSAMCTIHSGGDYHEKGWPVKDPDLMQGLPAISIPQFPNDLGWYPICGYSAILNAVGMYEVTAHHSDTSVMPFKEGEPLYLNRSFRELAFNVLQSIIRHEYDLKKANDDSVQRAEDNRAMAKIAIKRLAALYPNEVPGYCRDLLA